VGDGVQLGNGNVVGVEVVTNTGDKGISSEIGGRIVGGTSYPDTISECAYGDIRDPVKRFQAECCSPQQTADIVGKGVHGQSDVPLHVNTMRVNALRIELESRGYDVQGKLKPELLKILRTLLAGNQMVPPFAGSTLDECNRNLQRPLLKHARAEHDWLHDGKGSMQKHHVETHARQSPASKKHMSTSCSELGQGAERSCMTMVSWRTIFASFAVVYEQCSVRQRRIAELLSTMCGVGGYSPPEQYCLENVLHYALLSVAYEVEMIAEYGNGKMKSKVTATSIFGRYFKGLVDGGERYRLGPLYRALCERFEELFARLKKLVATGFCPKDLLLSVLVLVRYREGIRGASRRVRRMSTPAPTAENKISKLHCASLIKEYGVDAPIVRYFQNRSHLEAVSTTTATDTSHRLRTFRRFAYVITVVIKMSDIYVGDALKGSRIVKDLGQEVTAPNGRKVRLVEFDLEKANIRGNMKKFHYRVDDGASLKEYTSRKFVEQVWAVIKGGDDMPIPGMSADTLRSIINEEPGLRAALGIVSRGEDVQDILGNALGVDVSSAPAVDVDANITLQGHQVELLAELRVQESKLAERAEAGMAGMSAAANNEVEPLQAGVGASEGSRDETDMDQEAMLGCIGRALQEEHHVGLDEERYAAMCLDEAAYEEQQHNEPVGDEEHDDDTGLEEEQYLIDSETRPGDNLRQQTRENIAALISDRGGFEAGQALVAEGRLLQGSMPLEEHAKQIAQETHESAIQHMLVRVREYVRQLEEGILPIALACPRSQQQQWGRSGDRGGGLVDTATDGASNTSDQAAQVPMTAMQTLLASGATPSLPASDAEGNSSNAVGSTSEDNHSSRSSRWAMPEKMD
jgi:hypothetical protein